jgi:dTDP-4-amino-4,6-dideoxygalactose transaminase
MSKKIQTTVMSANPRAGYLAHKDALDSALLHALEKGSYILGPMVKAFEGHFADYLCVKHCVGLASGTDAIQLGLRALGVGPGDLVIAPSHTAIATVSAIDWIGATALLVDIDPTTYTIDPQRVEDTLQKCPAGSVKAVIAVHLYGHPADMDALASISTRYGVPVVEDCAQAHGAMVGAHKVGAIGRLGAFSFYPTKNLGAFGDAGAIATNDSDISNQLRLLQQYGWGERYVSESIGYNSRLDELQASILDCKLGWLDGDNQRRREIARRYNEGLAGLPLEPPVERPGCRHVYHQYVIRTADREGLRRHLESQEIGTAILYPQAVHQQPGYLDRVELGPGGMTNTERIVKEILCLPMYPELTDAEVTKVIEAVRSYAPLR